MTIRLRILIGCAIIAAVGSTTAAAQNTLGELLDSGAKKLTKEEVRTALIGAHVTGKSFTGSSVETDYKADGSYSGLSVTSSGSPFAIVGTWTVDEGGKLCVAFHTRSGLNNSCAFYYTIADQYFISETDSDKNSPVVKRTIKK